MKRILVPLFLIMILGIIATLTLMSLGGPTSNGGPYGSESLVPNERGAQATATHAAEQFHIQLTAIAVKNQSCTPGAGCTAQP